MSDNTAGGPFTVTHRLVLSIAVPMTLAFVTTPLLGFTDTAVVGRMGSAAALAGLTIGAVLFDFLYSIFNFLRSSTTGLVAQAYGRGDLEGQRHVFWRALLLSLVCGAAMLLISPAVLKAGLFLMGATGEAAEVTSTYFSIRILAGPMALANFAILGFLLGRGQATAGLVIQIVINLINIVLAIWLGLSLKMGVAGVAWGTVAGETIGMLAGLALSVKGLGGLRMPPLSVLLDAARLKEMFALNRDLLIRTFVLLAAYMLMTRIGASFGPVTLAANAVLMNFVMISAFYLDGLANAAEQLTGRAIGAGYRPAFDRAVKLTTLWSMALAGAAALFFTGFGTPIIAFLTTVPEVQDAAREVMIYAALSGLTGALAFLMDGVFIGATWSRDMRNQMLLSFLAFLAALALLVPLLGNHGLWIAFNLFLLARGLFLYRLLPGKAAQAFAAQ
ncbi:MATE family efflux transporter [Gellertiella hungarica]|uniref:MATE family multidrug resistance protein n=1 Tax=Gellertiella hungarica TaxID=1572859 RepID=A0A7W6J372_9HYPH|nr:MATE family efflux transporter [Gellertiella hungarica]MBB4063914.1 MATE family multidrug resistance protein [Gellertiella hungarica]